MRRTAAKKELPKRKLKQVVQKVFHLKVLRMRLRVLQPVQWTCIRITVKGGKLADIKVVSRAETPGVLTGRKQIIGKDT